MTDISSVVGTLSSDINIQHITSLEKIISIDLGTQASRRACCKSQATSGTKQVKFVAAGIFNGVGLKVACLVKDYRALGHLGKGGESCRQGNGKVFG
jgi:hypothetical protein